MSAVHVHACIDQRPCVPLTLVAAQRFPGCGPVVSIFDHATVKRREYEMQCQHGKVATYLTHEEIFRGGFAAEAAITERLLAIRHETFEDIG